MMSLVHFLECCGGVENIARVLLAGDRLFLEVHDASCLQLDGSELGCEPVLGQIQVSYLTPDSLDQAELLELGKAISRGQAARAAVYARPTDCPHRPQWHISPPQGLLNDPNGFIYHNGQYHLFYQWYPYACVHKDKYWAHLTSRDLVNWQWQPVALTPSDWFDSHGVFSGHALSVGDELWLYYTGNTRIGEQRLRQTTQCLAISKDGLHFEKQGPVVKALPPGVTEHIRDPKIIRQQGQWLMLLGAQREDRRGRLAVYRSDDLRHWQFDRLYGDELGDFGYMWECPDLFELGGENWLVFGPQGIASDNPHHTIPHHNGIARVTTDDRGGLSVGEFQPLDHGFDFYAPQSLLTPDGRRVVSGWMGLPDEIDHPSRGWVHQLTALRELSWEKGRLLQRPAREIAQLHGPRQQITLDKNRLDLDSKSFDLQVTLEWGSTLYLFASDQQHCRIELDKENQCLRFDRSQTLIRQGDTVRELALDSDPVTLRILADSSSLEIFINEGAYVMTGRVFTDPEATGIWLDGGQAKASVNLLAPARAPFAADAAGACEEELA